MLRPSTSCPALKDAAALKQSPAPSGDPPPRPVAKRKMPKQQDFPVPPKVVEIAFDFQSTPQVYDREGTPEDASAAVVGTGAFGAVYKYVNVTAATTTCDASMASTTSTRTSSRAHDRHDKDLHSPPSSMEEEILEDGLGSNQTRLKGHRRPNATAVSKRPSNASMRSSNQQGNDTAAQAEPKTPLAREPGKPSRTSRNRSGSVLRTAASLPQLKQVAQQQASASNTKPTQARTSDDKSYASIVIKLCRTPITGSFDELPRLQRGASSKTKAGWHVRIVRGEGRLFRYLQKAQALHMAHKRSFANTTPSSSSTGHADARSESNAPNLLAKADDETHLVRMLVDLPANGQASGQIFGSTPLSSATTSQSVMPNAVRVQDMDSHSRPPYRMLGFEELVDLDAEFVDGAWTKGTRPWTTEQVENAARETALGLKFLHAHGIVHSDLKPANIMRDPRTGTTKLIDLGAARRFVRIEDQFKHSTSIVEERDAAMSSIEEEAASLKNTLCEGLTSLTGSPHFMAPEILLQATRYVDKDGQSRSTLKDYKRNPSFLPQTPSTQWLRLCLDDYAVGWGLKSDIWSWGCCVLSFLVRMLAPIKDRNNTALICPFDFTFDDNSDALHPLHELSASEKNLPHFHLWARIYPLRIQDIVAEGARITAKAQECMSPSLTKMVIASLRHHSIRPTAAQIVDALQPRRPQPQHNRHSYTNIHQALDAGSSTGDMPGSRAGSTTSLASSMVKPFGAQATMPAIIPTIRADDLSSEISGHDHSVHALRRSSDPQMLPTDAEVNRKDRLENKAPKHEGGLDSQRTQASITRTDRPKDEAKLRSGSGNERQEHRVDRTAHNAWRETSPQPVGALGLALGKDRSDAITTSTELGNGPASPPASASQYDGSLSPIDGAQDGMEAAQSSHKKAHEPIKADKGGRGRSRMNKVSNLNLRLANMISAMQLPGSRARSHSDQTSPLPSPLVSKSGEAVKPSPRHASAGGAHHTGPDIDWLRSPPPTGRNLEASLANNEPATPSPSARQLGLPSRPRYDGDLHGDDASLTESLLSSAHAHPHGFQTPVRTSSSAISDAGSPSYVSLSPFAASDVGSTPSTARTESPQQTQFSRAQQTGTKTSREKDGTVGVRHPTSSSKAPASPTVVGGLRERAESFVRRAMNGGRAEVDPPPQDKMGRSNLPLPPLTPIERTTQTSSASFADLSTSYAMAIDQGQRTRESGSKMSASNTRDGASISSTQPSRASNLSNNSTGRPAKSRSSTGTTSIHQGHDARQVVDTDSSSARHSLRRVSSLLRRRSNSSKASGHRASGDELKFPSSASPCPSPFSDDQSTRSGLGLGIRLSSESSVSRQSHRFPSAPSTPRGRQQRHGDGGKDGAQGLTSHPPSAYNYRQPALGVGNASSHAQQQEGEQAGAPRKLRSKISKLFLRQGSHGQT